MAGQFLPEAGGQQEGVVGGGTDHEDEEDALHLAVDAHHVVVGEHVDDRAGERQCEHGAENDHQGQQQAAVDEQQDHQDRHQGHGEQESVDAREGVGQVGLAGGGTGDPHGGVGHAFGGRPDAVEGVGEPVAQVGSQLHHAFQSGAVPGDECGRHLADRAGYAGHGGQRPRRGGLPVGHPPAVAVAAVVAGPDDDRGQRLLLPEGPLFGDDLRGLGAARQEGGLVVARDLAEPAGVRAEGSADNEPGEEQQDGQEPTGPSWGGGHRSPGFTGALWEGVPTSNHLNGKQSQSLRYIAAVIVADTFSSPFTPSPDAPGDHAQEPADLTSESSSFSAARKRSATDSSASVKRERADSVASASGRKYDRAADLPSAA